MPDQWTLPQVVDWLVNECVERYRSGPLDPGLHVSFHQGPSQGVPPDALVSRAFRILEGDGVVTGHVIDADNTDAVCIRDLQLTDRAILKLESSPDPGTDEGHAHIGFSNG